MIRCEVGRKLGAMLVLLLAAAALPACAGGGYELQGRVIAGDYSAITLVDADDRRLSEGDGLSGVALHVQLDPGQLKRRSLARSTSDGDGVFAMPIDLIGAGSFHYDIGVFARRSGRDPASGFFRLPARNKRVLIVMNRGTDRDTGEDPEDLYGQYERYRDGP
jgi:hypothetical protein